MIDKSTIARILETADIVDVISDFVSLRKRGKDYKGVCPFHDDKNPSMSVSPSRGIYKCFSCGAAGNAVKFVMDYEKLSYPEALKYLANKYHIEIIEKEETEEEKLAKTQRESLQAVTTFAQRYFYDTLLNHKEGKAIGLNYFQSRGYNEATIKKFGLGYALDSKDAFSSFALSKGYKTQFLVASGLSIERNNKLYDRFFARVIFPIHGISGNVIGFGARTLRNDKKTAKYLNSPESELYHKSNVLYGLYFAKTVISKKDKCYLVEGYTDVISFHLAGIENVVASSGTALTEGQIRLIKRFTQNISVIYDGDEAGIKASMRGIDLLLEQGMNIKVLALPDGEDPDSFSKSHSASELLDYIEQNEKDFILFKANMLIKKTNNDPVKKAGAINSIIGSIAKIPDRITRSVYAKECASIFGIEEKTILQDIRTKLYNQQKLNKVGVKIERKKSEPQSNKEEFSLKDVSFNVLEKEILTYLLKFGNEKIYIKQQNNIKDISVIDFIKDEFVNEEFELKNEIHKKLFNEIIDYYTKNNKIDEKHFINHIDLDISKSAIDILTTKYKLSKIHNIKEREEIEKYDLRDTVPKTINVYKLKLVEQQLDNLIEKAGEYQGEELVNIMEKIMLLNKIKSRLADILGRVII